MADDRCFDLAPGVSMPRVGFGTYQMAGAECRAAVLAALRAGTRHIDTASIYKNQEEVGAAIRESGLPRSEVFVTSKISPYEQGTAAAEAAVDDILERLGLDYVDLLLIHWPGVARLDPKDPKVPAMRLETWRVLERAVDQGRVRAIGVSNYEERHLRELLPLARIRPACNQFECHPRLPQRELRAVCHELGVVPVAYSSLGCGKLLAEPLVTSLARAEGRTPAQLLLKWGLQSGLAVLPKSVHPERIRDAAEPALLGWELAAGTMAALDGLSDGHHYCWDPSKIP